MKENDRWSSYLLKVLCIDAVLIIDFYNEDIIATNRQMNEFLWHIKLSYYKKYINVKLNGKSHIFIS